METPLLYPVIYDDGKLLVLDETLLPFKEKMIHVKTLEEAIEILGEMKTRAFGQVLLFLYSCMLFHKNATIKDIAWKFKKVRPTFDFVTLGEIISMQTGYGFTIEDGVTNFINSFQEYRRNRARDLAELLPQEASILTICNVNGELVLAYEEMCKMNKRAQFYVCETRPYLQGSRLTFWEFRRNDIPVKLLCDNQMANLMRDGKINCIVTGADRATLSGDIINKVGTYQLSRFAKHYNIPFYALTQYPVNIDIGKIEIEERPPEEVFMFLGGDFSKIQSIYPAFDIVKKEYITKCVELQKYLEGQS